MKPDLLNVVQASFQEDLWNSKTYETKNIDVCLPRPHEKSFQKKMNRKPALSKWSLKDSIFKDCKQVTALVIQKCFEFDWATMKKPRFRENINVELIKNSLRAIFLQM